MNTPEGWKHCDKCDTRVDCCLRGCAALAAASTPPEQPAAQGESYLSGVNVEALLRACAELGLSAEHSLEALAVPDVLAEHINRVSRAVIAAARKRPEAEVAEIMSVARSLISDAAESARVGHSGFSSEAQLLANLERLVRGGGS